MAPGGKARDVHKTAAEQLKAQVERATTLLDEWEALGRHSTEDDGVLKAPHSTIKLTEKKLAKMNAKGSNDADTLHKRKKLQEQVHDLGKEMKQHRDLLKDMNNPTAESERLIDLYHKFVERKVELGVEKKVRIGQCVGGDDAPQSQRHLDWVSEILEKLRAQLQDLESTQASEESFYSVDASTLALKIERHSWHIDRLQALQQELRQQGENFAPEKCFANARAQALHYLEGAYEASEEEFIDSFCVDAECYAELGFSDGPEGSIIWEPVAMPERTPPGSPCNVPSLLDSPQGHVQSGGEKTSPASSPSGVGWTLPDPARKSQSRWTDSALHESPQESESQWAQLQRSWSDSVKPAHSPVHSLSRREQEDLGLRPPPLPSPLPPDWQAVWCEKESEYYYWHKRTGVTTWEHPQDRSGSTCVPASTALKSGEALENAAAAGALKQAPIASHLPEPVASEERAAFPGLGVYVCSRYCSDWRPWNGEAMSGPDAKVFRGELLVISWWDEQPQGWAYGCIPEKPMRWGYIPQSFLALPRQRHQRPRQKGDRCAMVEAWQAPPDITGYLTVERGDLLVLLDKTYQPHAWAYVELLSSGASNSQTGRGWIPTDLVDDIAT